MKHKGRSKQHMSPNSAPGYQPAHPKIAKNLGYGSRKSYMKPIRVGRDPLAHGKIQP